MLLAHPVIAFVAFARGIMKQQRPEHSQNLGYTANPSDKEVV
jgi:hypothetical protein